MTRPISRPARPAAIAACALGAALLAGTAGAQDIPISLSQSSVAVVGNTGLRIANIEAGGQRYVADLQWDARRQVFVPVAVAAQGAAALTCNVRVPTNSDDTSPLAFTLTAKIDPVERVIRVWVVNDGPNLSYPFSRTQWTFVQNQKRYAVSVFASEVNVSTALLVPPVASSVSTIQIPSGVKADIGTVSNLPAEFDFSMPLSAITYHLNKPIACQP